MTGRILVAYATKHGSTLEVAEAIASALRNRGHEVKVELRLRGDRLRGQAAVASDAAVASTYLERYPRARAAIRAAEPATFVRIRELEPSPGRLHKEVSVNVR